MKNRVHLSLGSNLGRRSYILGRALADIRREVGDIIRSSDIYESPSWGFQSGNSFLNQVILLETSLSAPEVLDKVIAIEARHGRVRGKAGTYQDRTLDIDLLYAGRLVCATPRLSLPHPLLHLRRFILLPLVTIDPDFVHPVLGLTNRELLTACQDMLEVTPYNSTEYEELTSI